MSQRQVTRFFMDATGASAAVASKYLRKTNYGLDKAVELFFIDASKSDPEEIKKRKNLQKIFDSYKDSETGAIGIDGTIRYFADMKISLEDVVVLAIAKLLGSEAVGEFKETSFIEGWRSLNVSTLEEMQESANSLREKLMTDNEYLKEVYNFTFGFLLSESQRVLPLETACDYWTLLLSNRFPQELPKWLEFVNSEYGKSISRDTWNMVYLFLEKWEKDAKLESYDESAAWPSVIDMFVEYLREKNLL